MKDKRKENTIRTNVAGESAIRKNRTICAAMKNFALYVFPSRDVHTRVQGICHFVTACSAGVFFSHCLYKEKIEEKNTVNKSSLPENIPDEAGKKENRIRKEKESERSLKIIKGRVPVCFLLLFLALSLLSGCSHRREEKVTACQVAYASLVELHNSVIRMYAATPKNGYEEKLGDLEQHLQELGEIAMEALDQETLEKLEQELMNLSVQYEEMYQEIQTLTEKKEEPKLASITLTNTTSIRFQELWLYPVTDGEGISLLLEEQESYDGYDIFTAVGIPASGVYRSWKVRGCDEEGDWIEFGTLSLSLEQKGHLAWELVFDHEEKKGSLRKAGE